MSSFDRNGFLPAEPVMEPELVIPFEDLVVGVVGALQVMVLESLVDGLAEGLILQLGIDLMKNGPQPFQLLFIFRKDVIGMPFLALLLHVGNKQFEILVEGRLWGGVEMPGLPGGSLWCTPKTTCRNCSICSRISVTRDQELLLPDRFFILRVKFGLFKEGLDLVADQPGMVHPQGGASRDVFEEGDPLLTHFVFPLDVGDDVHLFHTSPGKAGNRCQRSGWNPPRHRKNRCGRGGLAA